ncbi:DnaA N-terminal domain-containing protein [Pseudorhodobacter aquimaris]|uniref:DnaA N-terminal domain-containing protein n=1 Tax=Pseudorhodobacter aquimaris TaxID=687412 RepID=UPI00067AC89C|nr:DnaA N-terminal domain-containing protein [Pseudorhodobacter aquimaris]
MLVTKPVGRDASTKKYDILSALSAYALSQDKHAQRRILRLMSLITTRYNWQRNELSMGQEDIARLWSVDLRTVKREMAKLRALGWLVETRGAARGRVALHALDLAMIMADTQCVWPNIGPDFIERQAAKMPAPETTNVVPFQQIANIPADGSVWAAAQHAFQAQDGAAYSAWISRLSEIERDGGTLCLLAPSRFHKTYVETHLADRLTRILRRIDPSISGVRIDV